MLVRKEENKNYLKERREELHLSVRQVARYIKVSPSLVSQIETYKTALTTPTVNLFVKFFNIDANLLFYNDGNYRVYYGTYRECAPMPKWFYERAKDNGEITEMVGEYGVNRVVFGESEKLFKCLLKMNKISNEDLAEVYKYYRKLQRHKEE